MELSNKINVIDEICNLHPSLGVEKGWSHYTGGMKDSGDWYFRKMLDVPIEELNDFLTNKLLSEQENKLAQIKEEEYFKSSGMSIDEWNMKRFDDMAKHINEQMIKSMFGGKI